MRRSLGRSSRPTSSRSCEPPASRDCPRPERGARRRHRLHVRAGGRHRRGSAPSSRGARSTTRAAPAHRLDELRSRTKLRGIRHLIHKERDPHWILRPRRPSRRWRCSRRGSSCSSCLPSSRTISATSPSSPVAIRALVVVDHLGKPPLGTPQMQRWEELLRAAAEQLNVYAKVSGLNTVASAALERGRPRAGGPVAVDAFGASRLVMRERLARRAAERRLRARLARDHGGDRARRRAEHRPDPDDTATTLYRLDA